MLSLSRSPRLGIVLVGSAQSEMQKRWGDVLQKGHIKPN